MSEWANLCGTDGKVKATLNRRTGELRIKDHGEIHHWNVIDLCRAQNMIEITTIGDLMDGKKSVFMNAKTGEIVTELLDGQTAY